MAIYSPFPMKDQTKLVLTKIIKTSWKCPLSSGDLLDYLANIPLHLKYHEENINITLKNSNYYSRRNQIIEFEN